MEGRGLRVEPVGIAGKWLFFLLVPLQMVVCSATLHNVEVKKLAVSSVFLLPGSSAWWDYWCGGVANRIHETHVA